MAANGSSIHIKLEQIFVWATNTAMKKITSDKVGGAVSCYDNLMFGSDNCPYCVVKCPRRSRRKENGDLYGKSFNSQGDTKRFKLIK